jgi:serine/threonine-protein kinase
MGEGMAINRCLECGNEVRDSSRFCDSCGKPISSFHEDAVLNQIDSPPPTLRLDDPFIGQILDSRYELLARIGEGGMGVVYRARRIHIGGEVAIKILHPKFLSDSSGLERFRREARAAGALGHPNIIAIHDFVESVGSTIQAFIVMELVSGESLRLTLKHEGSFKLLRALAFMREICAGLGEAHRNNVIHRDVKPANIIVLMSRTGAETGSIKIVDFGLAKVLDLDGTTLTQVGALLGTPTYMSPEQCEGQESNAQSDVYSLGVMLFEMLSGSPPFVANNITQLALKHLRDTPPPLPSALAIPDNVCRAITRALAKSRDERQADALAFWEDLGGSNLHPISVGGKTPFEIQPDLPSEDCEEKGMWDFAAEIEEAFEELSNVFTVITAENQKIGEKATAHTDSLNAENNGTAGQAGRKRKILLLVASDLALCASRLEKELPKFELNVGILNTSVFGLIKHIRVTSEPDAESLADFRLKIQELEQIAKEAGGSIFGLRDSVANLRGMSKEVNRSSRRLATAFDGVIENIRKVERFSRNSVSMMNQLLLDSTAG